ncbi:MAG: TIGR04282 family arsenosugar biosynthesis glycosyltransferase [Verrucomicrobia bacterium]|nr:TIGR04282 family arsenosugar biosynthesis glycosyltransferase [Verrucomicrobiota bacterium]
MDSPRASLGGVVVLLRAPRRGQVKRRLAAELGEDAALDAYRRLLAGTLKTLAPVARVQLCVTPDAAAGELESLRQPGWTLVPQGSGDLGSRLHRMLVHAFARDPDPWLAIGTDCPELTEADLHDGWQALATSDVVLGPAADGGYWMIGMHTPQPGLFEEISWGGPGVFQETTERAAALGLRVHTLRILRDVDRADDWIALRSRGFLAAG